MTEREIYAAAVQLVQKGRGKLEVCCKVGAATLEELSVAYTPGVAEPTRQVRDDHSLQYAYTARASMLAIVTDGSAVLGLGDIGPEAAMVVMEGKGVMLKHFAGADPVPICLNTKDVDAIVSVVTAIEPSFGFIFLEDIAAPRCFEVEERLRQALSIPVFHDDQHGTAMAICAGLKNVLRLDKRDLADLRVVINGAGASALATAQLLLHLGARHLVVCDTKGALYAGRADMNAYKARLAERTNAARVETMEQAMEDADVFIGLSKGGLLKPDTVRRMRPNATVFAMANPDPEILPPAAKGAGARYIGTGRFDYPNTVNNLLAFPGIVKGCMDSRASQVTMGMKLAAIDAIAGYVGPDALAEDNLLPNPLDPGLALAVARVVAAAAREDGVARA
jgi:malate dehydrogenase (oxaloacetate-decarboxylating)